MTPDTPPSLDARIDALLEAMKEKPGEARALLADFWYQAQAEFNNQWRRDLMDAALG